MKHSLSTMVKEENLTLNTFKGIACVCVVLLHVEFPINAIDVKIKALCRFAVPLFFMISGYFSYKEEIREMHCAMIRKAKHIATLLLKSYLFYFTITIITGFSGENQFSVIEALKSVFSFNNIIRFVFFNIDPFIEVLWYIAALLYVYLIYAILTRREIMNIHKLIILALVLCNIVMGNILPMFNIQIPSMYYRNFLFTGIPMFAVGLLIRQTYEKNSLFGYAKWKLIILTIILEVISVLEERLFGNCELFISSILVACCMLIFAIQNPKIRGRGLLYKIGRDYSMYIYILQIFVVMVEQKAMTILKITEHIPQYIYFRQPVIITGCVLLSAIIFEIYQMVLGGVIQCKKKNAQTKF